jgi:hypothetical protein
MKLQMKFIAEKEKFIVHLVEKKYPHPISNLHGYLGWHAVPKLLITKRFPLVPCGDFLHIMSLQGDICFVLIGDSRNKGSLEENRSPYRYIK